MINIQNDSGNSQTDSNLVARSGLLSGGWSQLSVWLIADDDEDEDVLQQLRLSLLEFGFIVVKLDAYTMSARNPSKWVITYVGRNLAQEAMDNMWRLTLKVVPKTDLQISSSEVLALILEEEDEDAFPEPAAFTDVKKVFGGKLNPKFSALPPSVLSSLFPSMTSLAAVASQAVVSGTSVYSPEPPVTGSVQLVSEDEKVKSRNLTSSGLFFRGFSRVNPHCFVAKDPPPTMFTFSQDPVQTFDGFFRWVRAAEYYVFNQKAIVKLAEPGSPEALEKAERAASSWMKAALETAFGEDRFASLLQQNSLLRLPELLEKLYQDYVFPRTALKITGVVRAYREDISMSIHENHERFERYTKAAEGLTVREAIECFLSGCPEDRAKYYTVDRLLDLRRVRHVPLREVLDIHRLACEVNRVVKPQQVAALIPPQEAILPSADRRASRFPPASYVCHTCHRSGHWRRECPESKFETPSVMTKRVREAQQPDLAPLLASLSATVAALSNGTTHASTAASYDASANKKKKFFRAPNQQ